MVLYLGNTVSVRLHIVAEAMISASMAAIRLPLSDSDSYQPFATVSVT